MKILALCFFPLFGGIFLALRQVLGDAAHWQVTLWWAFLSCLAITNIAAWILTSKSAPSFRRPQLILSLFYVLGCGFRSFFPRADVQRICLFDSWLSSVAVGRSVATVAELCFVAQWSLLLREYSRLAGTTTGVALSHLLLPLILIAEICSWYGVLTTNYIGNTIEESLWAFTAVLLAIGLACIYGKAHARQKKFVASAIAACAAYVFFMITVDVSMYYNRWRADEAAGKVYLSLANGFHDVATRWHVTYSFEDWRTEIAWMSLYFSLAVWLSIGLCRLPRFQAKN